jgi:hypothetical protein
MKTKQRMLTEDWEIFKQRRFIEEQVRLSIRQAIKGNVRCSAQSEWHLYMQACSVKQLTT